MKKAYFYGMITLIVIFGLCALFGMSNHFLKFYKPEKLSNYKAKEETKPTKKDPTPAPTPAPDPDPDPTPTPSGKTEVEGYQCKTKSCDILKDTTIINNKYVFIQDGTDNIVLWDISEKKEYATYKKVTKAGQSFITQDKTDMYGAIKVTDKVENVIEPKFLYVEYNETDSQYMVTTQSHSSYIADVNGKQISATYVAQIMQYNDKYIVTRTSANQYHVFNFNNQEFLTEYVNSKRLFIELVGDYVGVITGDYKYIIYDFRENQKIIGDFQLDEGVSDARARISGRKIEIYRANNVLKTINL